MLTSFFKTDERKIRKHVHTNHQGRLGFYSVYVLDRWAFLNALQFSSPQLLQLRCTEKYCFSICAEPGPLHRKKSHPKIPSSAPFPEQGIHPTFCRIHPLFVEFCFFGNSALSEIFRFSHDFHLHLYDPQNPDNFCIGKRWRKTELFKYNKVYDNERI